MMGCDRCGAQALPGEPACPVCGAGLPASTAGRRRDAPDIPVRRHGKAPRPPAELLAPERGAASLLALGLGALGVALLVGGLGYWFW